MFKKILVGLDGSEGSWKALRAALTLSKLGRDGELWAVFVEEGLPRLPEVIDELAEEKDRQDAAFNELRGQAQRLSAEAGVALKVEIVVRHAAQAIVRFADQDSFDLLVIGQSGRSGVWGSFLGSTADKMVRHASCAVLVVR